ncbi:MAG TPA: hypothetical protein VFH73_19040, partial [Polyangia bacterium]|nr:hypothetical protein [Polyangia bacterium]
MLATLADAPLQDAGLVYEPKYDGIRAVIEVDLKGNGKGTTGGASVRIWSRLGNEKTLQFPEVVAAVARWASAVRRQRAVVLDGEIVALDEQGQPTGFQGLQDRIHLTQERDVIRAAGARPVALVVFDLLRDGGDDLRGRPLLERRALLEAAVKGGLS